MFISTGHLTKETFSPPAHENFNTDKTLDEVDILFEKKIAIASFYHSVTYLILCCCHSGCSSQIVEIYLYNLESVTEEVIFNAN